MKKKHQEDLTTENKLHSAELAQDAPAAGEQEAAPARSGKRRRVVKKDSRRVPRDPQMAERLDDTSDLQSIYEQVALQKRINWIKIAVFSLLAVVFLFLAGSYLVYLYSDVDSMLVGIKEHTHVYAEEGTRHDGDCRHYGYWAYLCTVPYCTAEKQIWDAQPGNHKYNMTQYEVVRENGRVYHVYTCDICGKLNYKLISGEGE